MEAAPIVSIITSVYNTEDYLSRCIESIIHQDLKEWELLLIDDGSTNLYQGRMHEKLRSFHPLPLDMKPKIRRRLRWLQRSALFYL